MSDKTYNDRDDKKYWEGKIMTARPYVPASGPDPLSNRSKFVPRVKKVEDPPSSQIPLLDIPPQNVKMSYENFLSAALPKVNKKQKRETREEPQTPTKRRTPVPVYSPSWNMATPDSVKKEYMEKRRLEQEAISPTNLFPEDEDSPEEFTELFEITEEKGGRRLQKTKRTKKSRKSRKIKKTRKTKKSKKNKKNKK
jgi:hypothetical protein